MELLFGLSLLTKLSLMIWTDLCGNCGLEDGICYFCFGSGDVVVNVFFSNDYLGWLRLESDC